MQQQKKYHNKSNLKLCERKMYLYLYKEWIKWKKYYAKIDDLNKIWKKKYVKKNEEKIS